MNTIANVLWILGVVIFIFGGLFTLVATVFSLVAGGGLGLLMTSRGGEISITISIITFIVLSLGTVLYGLIPLAVSELIRLFLSIEQHTHRSTELLFLMAGGREMTVNGPGYGSLSPTAGVPATPELDQAPGSMDAPAAPSLFCPECGRPAQGSESCPSCGASIE